MDSLIQDVRYAWRMMLKSPGFTLIVIMTMALGVGANTAVFSVVKSVLLNPLPYPDSDRLVQITFNQPGAGLKDVRFSGPELQDIQAAHDIFDAVSAVYPSSANLTGGTHPERLEILATSPSYFSMLGAHPQLGRLFEPQQDTAQGFAEAVVISDGLWQRLYGADRDVLGKRLFLDGDAYTIVGVLPPEFRHPGKTITKDIEVWLTAGFDADPFPPHKRNFRLIPGAIGLLHSGTSLVRAQQKLDALAASLRLEYASDYRAQDRWSIGVQPLLESLVGNVRPMLVVLMAAVVVIILIGSVNIANLLLARASARHKEMALRSALGATGTRVTRQLLTESLVLSLIGGSVGVLVAMLSLRVVVLFAPQKIHRLTEINIDWVVLGFALLVSVVTAFAFGLVPALQSRSTDVFCGMREGSSGSGQSKKIGQYRAGLIISEMALAIVLMVGAGLLLRTFWGLVRENPGFKSSNVVGVSLRLPVPNDPKADPYITIEAQNNFVQEALHRISGVPGVEMVGTTSSIPLGSNPPIAVPLEIENQPADSSTDVNAEVIQVSPDYFNVMGITLLHGRTFDDHDKSGKLGVAIIDETTARRYWPAANPLGTRIRLGRLGRNQPEWRIVVGIIRDVKHDGLDRDGIPHVYLPVYQFNFRDINFAMRTSLPAETIERQIRQEIQSIDPSLPLFNIRSMDEVVSASLATRQFSASLVAAFAAVALFMVSIGVYGLLANLVEQRARELAIRMALGAQRADVFKMILGKGTMIATIGIICGIVISLFVAPTIDVMLYGVHPIDPFVFLAVPALLLGVALVASFIPARRAASNDPIVVLRGG
jgi:predicted permease